jgi:single-strand DNA-binding protein
MLNHITIMGRLTKDPELRRTGSGIAVASFTLAVDRDFTEKGSDKRETDFIDCVAWRGTAEFVSKYLQKGRMAVASGRLQLRDWTDKDGNKRRSAEVVADNVYFADSKNTAENGGSSATAPAAQAWQQPAAHNNSANNFAMLDDDDAELPF